MSEAEKIVKYIRGMAVRARAKGLGVVSMEAFLARAWDMAADRIEAGDHEVYHQLDLPPEWVVQLDREATQ